MVVQRNHNRSAFSGYKRTWSEYSAVACTVCHGHWRTRAGYVRDLPDGLATSDGWVRRSPTTRRATEVAGPRTTSPQDRRGTCDGLFGVTGRGMAPLCAVGASGVVSRLGTCGEDRTRHDGCHSVETRAYAAAFFAELEMDPGASLSELDSWATRAARRIADDVILATGGRCPS